MDDETKFRKDNKKRKFIKRYKRHGIVESHDCQHPKGAWHIDEVG